MTFAMRLSQQFLNATFRLSPSHVMLVTSVMPYNRSCGEMLVQLVQHLASAGESVLLDSLRSKVLERSFQLPLNS